VKRLVAAIARASALCTALIAAAPAQATKPVSDASVDALFAEWTRETPGCAVGVSEEGRIVLQKAYGMADLEHGLPNRADTIFEAGSVSKQFTAAAVLLLARDGKLSLDDPVRRYVPELPDYAAPVTIRQMLQHTSGLRDWGSVAWIAGASRGTRAYTHAHVLDILSRQEALNFTPGTRWSYSNSGYNLSAVIVSRVSGMSFAEFSRTRIFAPLGLTSTSWRDDHTRIVKNRAVAYSAQGSSYSIEMPFENVHGNGGLLTTVGDLLKWNEHFTSTRLGDASFIAEQQQAGRFTDGRAHDYALGLRVGIYKGVRQVDHSGSTAGYRAHLARYPDQNVSVAVLCNVSTGDATRSARAVADILLGKSLKPVDRPKGTYSLTEADATRIAGLYRDTVRGLLTTIARDQTILRIANGQGQGGTALTAVGANRFVTADAATWEFETNGRARVTDEFGTVDTLERVEPAKPTREQLQALMGSYTSNEIETTLNVVLDGDALAIKRRPDTTIALRPIYADAFSAGSLGLVIFRRDASGQPTALSVVQDRVWDLRFAREGRTTTSAR
jgi:CubicO group peptidase (beta-lactamase class C family)